MKLGALELEEGGRYLVVGVCLARCSVVSI